MGKGGQAEDTVTQIRRLREGGRKRERGAEKSPLTAFNSAGLHLLFLIPSQSSLLLSYLHLLLLPFRFLLMCLLPMKGELGNRRNRMGAGLSKGDPLSLFAYVPGSAWGHRIFSSKTRKVPGKLGLGWSPQCVCVTVKRL